MNFLPFVLIFFLVFGAISASFMSDGIIYRAESSSYIGRVRSLRISYNKGQENLYDKRFRDIDKKAKKQEKSNQRAQKKNISVSLGLDLRMGRSIYELLAEEEKGREEVLMEGIRDAKFIFSYATDQGKLERIDRWDRDEFPLFFC